MENSENYTVASINSTLTESTYVSTCPSSPSTFGNPTSTTTTGHRVALSPAVHNEPDSINTTAPHRRRLQREWKQKSIVRRASSIIKTEVTHMITNSSFLNRPDVVAASKRSTIPSFHRSEIQTGSLIGAGGFSNVCEITAFALDPTISERCTPEQQLLREDLSERVRNGTAKLAIKHLKRALALSSAKVMSRAACDLIMEATYMSSMDHPNILPIRALPIDSIHSFDTGDYDGYFIIMDELSNTLGDEIQNWKRNVNVAPSITEKMDYALQVAAALEYLHTSCRMIFRDLKPQNIGFLDSTVQLFDFGLCRELPCDDINDESNIDGNVNNNEVYEMSGVGTRRYMAPEIINDGKYNTKVDVYGWSMVVSELITGIKPYANYDVEEHRVAVCQGGERPHIHCFWPQWLQSVLHNTWCESVTNRWSIQQVTLFVSKMIHDDDNSYKTSSECELPRSADCERFIVSEEHVPDSPVDVQQVKEFDMSPANWLLIPELPDLYSCSSGDNSTTTSSGKPKRRHSLNPRLVPRITLVDNDGDDESSILFDRDGSNNVSKEFPLTICNVNGTVEVVACRPYIPPQKPVVPTRSSLIRQHRANSCMIMLQ